MPTLYVDYESGNDNYGGTSFALLASGADGANTTGGAFTSASASFPNDGSLINQYLSIFNGSIYAVYRITAWVSATALTVVIITGGTALSAQSARQYYIGGRWQTLNAGATAVRIVPGDTLRFKASPTPTAIGNATWVGGGRPVVNLPTANSATNASPIVLGFPSAHGVTTGDIVRVTAVNLNTNANGIWKVGTTTSTTFQILQLDGANTTGNGVGTTGVVTLYNNLVVRTATPLVKNIALLGGRGEKPAWTAATADITSTQSTASNNFKEGNAAAQIAIGAAFTTGKAAYYTLPATLDLSAYQQVSFWVRRTAGTNGAAGQTYVALCTDTTGGTVAHICNVPLLSSSSSRWTPVTVDLGTNLNAAIRSVAFYVVTDLAAQTFQLDNIIACKAASDPASLSLTSLISKSDGTGDEGWYAAQFLNSDTMMLSSAPNYDPTQTDQRGYNGVSETVATYKQETIKVAPVGLFSNVFVLNEGGSATDTLSITGGWDRTNMSTQTGQTWFDGQSSTGTGLNYASASLFTNISIDRLNFCRFGEGTNSSAGISNSSIGSMYCTNCDTTGIVFNANCINVTATSLWAYNNFDSGITLAGTGINITDIKLASNNGSTSGVFINSLFYSNIGTVVAGNNGTSTGSSSNIQLGSSLNCTIGTATLTNARAANAIRLSGSTNMYINGGTSSNNSIAINATLTSPSTLYLNSFTINEAVEVTTATNTGTIIYSNRNDNTDNNSWVWQSNLGTINQQTSVVDSPATTAWQMRPTSTRATTNSPIFLKLGTIVCAASSLVTVTARMRRTNTGLTMRLVCPGGQILGVASNVTANMTAAADTWETVTITFTPTKAGAVDIYSQAFGGTTFSGYVCNLTASQA
jgi:hypothetical protein